MSSQINGLFLVQRIPESSIPLCWCANTETVQPSNASRNETAQLISKDPLESHMYFSELYHVKCRMSHYLTFISHVHISYRKTIFPLIAFCVAKINSCWYSHRHHIVTWTSVWMMCCRFVWGKYILPHRWNEAHNMQVFDGLRLLT